MKALTKRKRGRGGFSLAEMLVVIAIILVLAGVVAVAVARHRAELKQTELDDSARSIYMAAQNQLTALKAASGGGAVEALTSGAGIKLSKLNEEGTITGTVYYVSNSSAGSASTVLANLLVPPSSIEGRLSSSQYLVEYDPASGAVYGVFYSEENVLSDEIYEKIATYTPDARTRTGRRKLTTDGVTVGSETKKLKVGYYGWGTGSPALTGPTALRLPSPTVKIINAEELILDVQVSEEEYEQFKADYKAATSSDFSESLTFSVTVNGFSKKIDISSTASTISSGALSFHGRLVLDTLDNTHTDYATADGATNMGVNTFSGWNTDAINPLGITLGQDFTVYVTLSYEVTGGTVGALPQTATVKTNSLFAGVTLNEKVIETDPDTYTVQIAYGRHLQNLNKLVTDSAITKAEQLQDIDFLDASARRGVYSWAETYGVTTNDSTGEKHPTKSFTPVNVASGDVFKAYDGRNCRISNLYVDSSENAGVFGSFDGSASATGSLSNVILVNPRVTGTGSAGALAGEVSGSAVSGCHVYADMDYRLGADMSRVAGAGTPSSVGGLIGTMSGGSVTGCSASLPLVADTECVGGLIGSAANSQVEKSYADTGVRETDNTRTINGDTVDGNKDGWADATGLSGATVGGLVGDFTGTGTITNCYSAGYVNSATTAGGLMAAGNAIFSEKCYAAMDYNKDSGCVPATIFGAAPSGAAPENVYYLSRGRVSQEGIGTSINYNNMSDLADSGETDNWVSDSAWESAWAATTWPYGLPDGSVYPFPKLANTTEYVMDHYGDWCDAVEPILAYYEYYGGDDGFGFWYWDKVQNRAVSTLGERFVKRFLRDCLN